MTKPESVLVLVHSLKLLEPSGNLEKERYVEM